MPKKLGTKNSIFLALCVYAVIVILGYFMNKPLHFWVLALLVSMVQGGSQALSRSLYASMTAPSKSAEFFGFYNVSSKFAGIIGPALFAVVGQLAGSSRLGIISILVFFLFGALVLAKLDHGQGIEAAPQSSLSKRKELPDKVI